jgi:hypothetical protein
MPVRFIPLLRADPSCLSEPDFLNSTYARQDPLVLFYALVPLPFRHFFEEVQIKKCKEGITVLYCSLSVLDGGGLRNDSCIPTVLPPGRMNGRRSTWKRCVFFTRLITSSTKLRKQPKTQNTTSM